MEIKEIHYRESKKSEYGEFLYRRKKFVSLLPRLTRFTSLLGKEVLVVGCGYGPEADVLAESGAIVTATDINKEYLARAREWTKDKNITFVINKADELPFKDKEFSFLVCWGVLEHTENPEKILTECKRVLVKEGIMFLEFSPYYSPVGHHLYDYTLLPVQFLPDKFVKWYVMNKHFNPLNPKKFQTKEEETAHKLLCLDVLYNNLNKLSISQFQNIISQLEMKALEEKFIVEIPGILEINAAFIRHLGPIKELAFRYSGIFKRV